MRPHKASIITLALAIALLALITSCAPKPAIKPVAPPVRAIEGQVTVDALRDALFFKDISSLKSEVSVQVLQKNGDSQGTFSGVLAYKAPGSAALRLFGPLGLTVADLTYADGLLQVYVPIKNALFETRVPGISEIKKKAEGLKYALEETKEGYVLYAFKRTDDTDDEIALELAGIYVFTDKSAPVNTGITIYRNRSRYMDIAFDEFTAALPLSIKVAFMNGPEMRLHLIEPETNVEVPEEFFAPKQTEGKEVRPLKDLLRRVE